ncbi:hypothetical protein Pelo_18806 [Pelomyxa schiedti]|nr:hypothetical protein Pelo_18806 [Pelomyxa schiedti]
MTPLLTALLSIVCQSDKEDGVNFPWSTEIQSTFCCLCTGLKFEQESETDRTLLLVQCSRKRFEVSNLGAKPMISGNSDYARGGEPISLIALGNTPVAVKDSTLYLASIDVEDRLIQEAAYLQ